MTERLSLYLSDTDTVCVEVVVEVRWEELK